MNGTVYLYKNFLCNIFRILGILYYTNGRIENPVLVIIYQVLKCRFIAIAKTLYQFNLVQQLEGLGFDAVTYENMLFINAKDSDALSFKCSPDRNRTCIKSLGNFYSIH